MFLLENIFIFRMPIKYEMCRYENSRAFKDWKRLTSITLTILPFICINFNNDISEIMRRTLVQLTHYPSNILELSGKLVKKNFGSTFNFNPFIQVNRGKRVKSSGAKSTAGTRISTILSITGNNHSVLLGSRRRHPHHHLI
ncbi:uncharacterized protein LOC119657129 isoform X1 [Hermetia illucens]|uniref:uncharacterized protein LOC119657129 isoform X1 n=1 Tax=Hermetia illucens TaxID=343691 RepID=UPI0018CC4F31|nr:uncharacterized protein LOC119657129 isoform X1 [Hermetia illucens]